MSDTGKFALISKVIIPRSGASLFIYLFPIKRLKSNIITFNLSTLSSLSNPVSTPWFLPLPSHPHVYCYTVTIKPLKRSYGTTVHSELYHADTFIEGPASQDISSVGKARPPGTDSSVLWSTGFGTLLAVDTPGSTHWAAAHVHSVSPVQRFTTFVLMPLHVALLAAQI